MNLDILLLITVLTIAWIFTLFLGAKRPYLRLPVMVAFVVRSLVMGIGLTVVSLPGSAEDAVRFQKIALSRSEQGITGILSSINFNSHFYSDIVGLVYSILEPNILLMYGINLVAGVATVYWVGILSEELWEERIAQQAVWVAALFPTLVLNSAVTLRESLLTLSILLSCFSFLCWWRTRMLHLGVISAIFAAFSMMFHGAHAIDLGWLLILILLISLRSMNSRIKQFPNLLILLFSSLIVGWIIINFQTISLPKLGSLDINSIDEVVGRTDIEARGGAAYPAWLRMRSVVDYSWKWVPRIPYFLFSPFPWDIRSSRHLLALIDGTIYLVMFMMGLRAHGQIRSNPGAIILLVLILPTIFVYSMAVGNFGTGLRHRSKFVPIFIAIVAGAWGKYREEYRQYHAWADIVRANKTHLQRIRMHLKSYSNIPKIHQNIE